jgi:hypothetical protein
MQTTGEGCCNERSDFQSEVHPVVLVTGREIWLPTGNQVSRAPTVIGVTEQKISNLFEVFEF